MADRQRPQEERADDAKDGGVNPNPERNRQERDDEKAGLFRSMRTA